MKIIQTIAASNPQQAALTFGAILAADKGVQNEVRKHRSGWLVVADDNRAILFRSKQ